MRCRRERRRRPLGYGSASCLVLVASTLSSAPCNTAAPIILPSSDGVSEAFIGGHTVIERLRHLRHRHLNDHSNMIARELNEGNTNSCKSWHHHLYPGDTLLRGEFLCHGNLRFGIDADRGQFIVGFANSTKNENSTSSSDGGEDFTTRENNNYFNEKTYSLEPMPVKLAWRGTPTTLFIPEDRPFARITLTDDGNIFGYDDSGEEIYDSNYDFDNRVDAKEDNSILKFRDRCRELNNIDDIEGNMCVELTSPPRAGWPYGMVTWGVHVNPNEIVEAEPFDPTPAPVTPSPTLSPVPTPVATRRTRRPSWQQQQISYIDVGVGEDVESTATPPSRMPTTENGVFSDESVVSSVEPNYEATSIIWGTVWLDSNRNGAMDLGEKTVNNYTVELYECSYYRDTTSEEDDDDDDDGSQKAFTDDEGMYFFQVPTGRTYRVKFDIDSDVHGYSSGTDTDTNMLGWTECETSTYINPIQWNAGLYLIDEIPKDIPEIGALPNFGPTATPTEQKASIGGFIYLDVDENGKMDSKERTAAVGGYTVNDAMIAVSLTDCTTSEVLGSLDVPFPGTYSFGNLEEGLYKLGYEMQVISRGTNTGQPVPLYSFIDGSSETPTVYETPCGKLGKQEIIDSGNVGLRPRPLTPTPDDPSVFEEIDMMSSPVDLGDTTRAVEPDTDTEEKQSFVPVLVGVLVTLSVVAAASIILIKRRNGDLHTFPYPLGSPKSDREDIRSVGSSVGWETSVSAPNSADQHTAIGSLVVEAGQSVANMTPDGGDDASDESDSDLEQSYTGMEFALKQTQGTNQNSGSPYQSSFSPNSSRESSNHPVQIHDDGSEGYEVYDDEEDQSTVDYGPVVTDIIAKYSQKQQNDQQPMSSTNRDEQQQAQHDSQSYPAYQYQQTQTQNSQYQDQQQYQGGDMAIVPSNQEHAQNYQYGNEYNQGYYANNSNPHDASQQQYSQINANEYEDETSTSGSSFTSDPPAASYRDIPAGNVSWDIVGAHQQTVEHQQYDNASTQYVTSDGEYYEVGYNGANYSNANYDNGYNEQQQQQHHSSNSSSSSSEASEEASNSGWSDSSSTAASSAVSGSSSNFNWSYGSATSTKDRARRAQSNPRDDRRVASWRHQAAIPENSTLEYNAYNTTSRQNQANNHFAQTQADDNKSVISSGSDHSSDPPGASYKAIPIQFPPPPRRTTPPRRTSPNIVRRTSPQTSPNRRSFPPPPPPRSYSSPRPR